MYSINLVNRTVSHREDLPIARDDGFLRPLTSQMFLFATQTGILRCGASLKCEQVLPPWELTRSSPSG